MRERQTGWWKEDSSIGWYETPVGTDIAESQGSGYNPYCST